MNFAELNALPLRALLCLPFFTSVEMNEMGRDAVGWNVMEWGGTVWDGMGPNAMERDRFGCTRAAHTGAGTKKSCRSSSRLGLCPLDEAPVSEGDFFTHSKTSRLYGRNPETV